MNCTTLLRRYHLLYRILVQSPGLSVSITTDVLKHAGIYGVDAGAQYIKVVLFDRVDEYEIKVFKRHIRITRL